MQSSERRKPLEILPGVVSPTWTRTARSLPWRLFGLCWTRHTISTARDSGIRRKIEAKPGDREAEFTEWRFIYRYALVFKKVTETILVNETNKLDTMCVATIRNRSQLFLAPTRSKSHASRKVLGALKRCRIRSTVCTSL